MMRGIETMFLIFGLVEMKEENCLQRAIDFFKDVMMLPSVVSMQDVYRLGKFKEGKDRPMVVTLTHSSEKYKIFQNMQNLRGKRNSKNAKYRVKSQRSGRKGEMENRQRALVRKNKKKTMAERLTLNIVRGQLFIGADKYKKIVPAPTPRDLVNLEEDDRNRILDTEILAAPNPTECGNCKFYGFTSMVENIQQVRDAYMKLRIQNGKARHIVCAYRLPHKNFALYSDFEDDDEHGAGKHLLDILENAGIYNRAIYVVRFFGGEELGSARFEAYKEAASNAILHHPQNTVEEYCGNPTATQPS